MVDYDKAVATVQDPNADPVLLAKIAYENPEFGANVAVNPRCYPGLKRWLATFGDERARQTLAQMGVTGAGLLERYCPGGRSLALAAQAGVATRSRRRMSPPTPPLTPPLRTSIPQIRTARTNIPQIRMRHRPRSSSRHRTSTRRRSTRRSRSPKPPIHTGTRLRWRWRPQIRSSSPRSRSTRRNCAPASRVTPAPTRHWSTGSPS